MGSGNGTGLDERARQLVSAYYDHHAEYGEPPCPCEVCEKARAFFKDVLKEADERG